MDFCLLCSYGQPSTESNAAWVQAWGSLLALVVALGIAWYQGEREANLRRLDRHEKRQRELRKILFLAKAMEQWIINFRERYPQAVVYDKPAQSEAVGDLLMEIRETITDELDDAELNLYFQIRREFSEIFGHVHFGDIGVHANNYLLKIQRLIRLFANHLS